MTRSGPRRAVMTGLALIVLAVAVASVQAGPGVVQSAPPVHPDPAARYLFYLHGTTVETGQFIREAGVYEYDRILAAFAERGFQVIGEKRGPDTQIPAYAGKVSEQVGRLIQAGVPPGHITVAGHSKGGWIAIGVAARIRRPGINYAFLATCVHRPPGVTDSVTPPLQGRILSVYDYADTMTGSCQTTIKLAPGASLKESVIHVGHGHWSFYQPRPEWLDLVQAWAEGKDG
jgi:hypothetical protein